MSIRGRSFQSMYRSVAVFAMLIASAVAWSGVGRAQEPVSTAVAAETTVPIDVGNLEINGIEKIERGPYRGFLWSPDGTKALVNKTGALYYLYRPEDAKGMEGLPVGMRDLWVVDWASGQEELLAETAFRWAWSPDSSAVAYIVPVSDSGITGELYVRDLASASAKRIAEADILQSEKQPWWLETNEIVFIADAHIWSVQPDGSDLHQVNELHLGHFRPERAEEFAMYNGDMGDINISPSGKYITYQDAVMIPDSRNYRVELWLADLDGQNARLVDENGVEESWSPDGRYFAYVSQPDWEELYAWNLAVVDGETGEHWLVYEAPTALASPGRVVWSPGSDALAFREYDFGALEAGEIAPLWFVKVDGSEQRIFRDLEDLPAFQDSLEFMTWNKDGRHLLVIPGIPGGGGTPYVVELADSP